MDVLVRLEARPSDSLVVAHVNSIPVSTTGSRTRREVVTLYGEGDAHNLALALAATVESERLEPAATTIRHFGVFPDRGAVGDAAWRDGSTGQLVTRQLDIPLPTLQARASELLGSCGPILRRVVAGLGQLDWPEGTERALSFSLRGTASPDTDDATMDHWLDALRQAEASTFPIDGDELNAP